MRLTLPDNLVGLSEAQRVTIYRAAQEALTNTQRHAAAHTVWLEVQQNTRAVTLCVEDDGMGMQTDEFTPGIGLRGMQERAQQLGGALTIDASPRGGVRLRITLPLPQEKENG